LLGIAIGWVKEEYEILCTDITTDLEEVPYQELQNRDSVAHRKPEIDDVGTKRERP
jgi:hypothetical protein